MPESTHPDDKSDTELLEENLAVQREALPEAQRQHEEAMNHEFDLLMRIQVNAPDYPQNLVNWLNARSDMVLKERHVASLQSTIGTLERAIADSRRAEHFKAAAREESGRDA